MGFVVFIDQFSKCFALQHLSPQTPVSLIPQVLDLTLVRNPGVAFGLFSDYAPALFTVITASLVFLFLVANRSHGKAARPGRGSPSSRQETEAAQGTSIADRWALSLILGGAIGNWIDRLRFGAVMDFIDFRIFPVFNLADTAITIGVGLYFIRVLMSKDKS